MTSCLKKLGSMLTIMILALVIGAPVAFASTITDSETSPISYAGSGSLTDVLSPRIASAYTVEAQAQMNEMIMPAGAPTQNESNFMSSFNMADLIDLAIIWIPASLVLAIMLVTLYSMIKNTHTHRNQRNYHYFGHVWEL
jgi:hypothetical protein